MNLKVGDILVYDGYESLHEAELVKIHHIYKTVGDEADILVKPLNSKEEFRTLKSKLLTLEEADHKLWSLIREAEMLKREIGVQLNLKYNSNV